jgi:hypothetical protein
MQCEAEVGPQVFQPAPLPDFDAVLARQRPVAEGAARLACGFFRGAASLDEHGGTLGDVLLDLFREIVVGMLAKDEIAEPAHREPP